MNAMTHTITRSQTVTSLASQCREQLSAAVLEAIVGGQWAFTPSMTNGQITGMRATSGNPVASPLLW
jgi:hypothetical protein